MLTRRIRSTLLPALSVLFLSACGGKDAPPPKTPSDEGEAYDDTSGDEEISAEEEALLAQIDAEADLADEEAASDGTTAVDGQDSDKEKREVVYRVSPDGLKVEVMGAQFSPIAKAVRVGKGWGLELTVQARTDAELILFSPKTGPLAFGGKVKRSSVEKFGDRREGGAEVNLTPGKLVSFSRTWPEKGAPPLLAGEELELHVGLWGIGQSTEDRRPLTRFVVIQMKADRNGARPQIQPPGQ